MDTSLGSQVQRRLLRRLLRDPSGPNPPRWAVASPRHDSTHPLPRFAGRGYGLRPASSSADAVAMGQRLQVAVLFMHSVAGVGVLPFVLSVASRVPHIRIAGVRSVRSVFLSVPGA